jgi:hypothetical protein
MGPRGKTARTIAIGAAVRVAPAAEPHARQTQEGVVIEVVRPGCNPTDLRTCHDPDRDGATRYVVQCAGYRVLRVSRAILVVAP